MEEEKNKKRKLIEENNISLEKKNSFVNNEINSKEEVITCLHEVCLPPNLPENYIHEEVTFPLEPVKEYPFTLDPFQKVAISCIHKEESVLVSAHTSAGKTVVAEYAIALSLKYNQRVIYTSPIKALSNQKYRELYETFQDVGLMTGDITINPNASCLVMTTEILRSMLYRGSEIMREVAWVIFDEIHYMRDKERGVVWEETIILLPDKTHYVFLSATIPNANEFANWIAKIHNQPCHVVYTDVRPTPLQHYIFPSGSDGLFLVVDEKGNFKEDNFNKALTALVPKDNQGKDKKKGKKGPSDCYKIVKMIMERNYEPVIVFCFSKKECEALALQMSKIDLTSEEEKSQIEKVFSNAIDSLSDDDKKLPQVEHILPLLKRGIGIHHSGLLPLLKEIIEILFQEGLIKVLFATETFSMGLNMPAKTVVFTSVRKFDGDNFRWITSGEYIQMSGRAGRRGLDTRGIVIMMVDEKMEPQVAKNMVKGSADPLNSSFYISYNMLLNLIRVEEIDPEYMLRKSFRQYQNDKDKPKIEEKIRFLEEKKNNIQIIDEIMISEYFHIKEQLNKLKQSMRNVINQPSNILPFLQAGRLVRVKEDDIDWGWGVVINFQKKQDKTTPQQPLTQIEVDDSSRYIVDILLNCSNEKEMNNLKPCKSNETGQMQVIPVTLPLLDGISSVRIYIPKDLRPLENRQSVGKSIKEVQKRFPDGIPLLDPIEDMKIEDNEFKKTIRRVEMLTDKLTTIYEQYISKYSDINLEEQFHHYCEKMNIENEIKILKKYLKQNNDVILKHELKCMKRVLRRLGYTSSEDIIETKGRVACEINAADELVLTELIFSGVFNELEIEQIAALLSCFVFQEKGEGTVRLPDHLNNPYRQLQEVAKRIAKISQESKINLDIEEYVQKFVPHMMEVTYAWAKGAKFAEICGMTDIFEGSIIRCMRRLEETLRQLCAAAKSIGNTELENKFAEGILKIKRDIVFAASLYL